MYNLSDVKILILALLVTTLLNVFLLQKSQSDKLWSMLFVSVLVVFGAYILGWLLLGSIMQCIKYWIGQLLKVS